MLDEADEHQPRHAKKDNRRLLELEQGVQVSGAAKRPAKGATERVLFPKHGNWKGREGRGGGAEWREGKGSGRCYPAQTA